MIFYFPVHSGLPVDVCRGDLERCLVSESELGGLTTCFDEVSDANSAINICESNNTRIGIDHGVCLWVCVRLFVVDNAALMETRCCTK